MEVDIKEILVHPCIAIRLLEYAAEDVGIKKIIKERFYEKTREAWIAAVFLLGLRKIEGHPWWFKVNSEHLAPDVYAYKFLELEKNKVTRFERLVEVFRWVEDSGTTIIGEIEKKLSKRYPPNFTLVCYVIRERKINLAEVISDLKSVNPNISEIWVVETNKLNPREVLIGRVWPEVLTIQINLDEICGILGEPQFLVPYRGYKKSSMYEKLGKTALLKPDFSLEEIDRLKY